MINWFACSVKVGCSEAANRHEKIRLQKFFEFSDTTDSKSNAIVCGA